MPGIANKFKVKNRIQVKAKSNVLPLPATTGVNTKQECPKHELRPKAVQTGVNTLLQVIKVRQDEEKRTRLFKDEPKGIFLQILPIKVPVTHMQQVRITLPHPLTIEGTDVCLITQNVAKSTKDDHEPTIAYYKSLLKEKNIKGITEIVPIRLLRSEHIPFEMKGRFANIYDTYLVDGRLFGKVTKILGSRFFKKNKDLIPVKINTDNVKEELEKALAKTVLTVHGNGDSYSVKVGYSSFTVEQLEANIYAVADVLAKSFPGGFVNIRKLLVKTTHSMAIPIYVSLKPHNSVPIPVVKPNLPKAYKPMEGELSTHVGLDVTVMPTGEVIVSQNFTAEDIEMGWGETEEYPVAAAHVSDVAAREADHKPATAKLVKRKADESSDDEDVEAAEDAYMSGLRDEPDQAKTTDTAQAEKAAVTSKRQAAKAKKQASQRKKKGGKAQHKMLLEISNGESADVLGVKCKQLNTTPKIELAKVKEQPELEEKLGVMAAKRKKLNTTTPKVQLVKVAKGLEVEKESGIVDLKGINLKASPKALPGKAKQQLQEGKQITPNFSMKLTPSKEDLKAFRLKVKKEKALEKAASKQLMEGANVVVSPNAGMKLTPSKTELKALKLKAKKQKTLQKAATKERTEDAIVLGSPNAGMKLTPSKAELKALKLKANKQKALQKAATKEPKEDAIVLGSPIAGMKLTPSKGELKALKLKEKKEKKQKALGKARTNQIMEGTKAVGSPNASMKLTPSKGELKALKLKEKKEKKQKALAKAATNQIMEVTKAVGSPNASMKLTPSKEELKALKLKANKEKALAKAATKQVKEVTKAMESPNASMKLTSSKEELKALKLKANKEKALAKAAIKQVKEITKAMESPNASMKLTPSKGELKALKMKEKKEKKQKALEKAAANQIGKDAKTMGSPNTSMNLTPRKEKLKFKKQKALDKAANVMVSPSASPRKVETDLARTTGKMTRTSFKGPAKATALVTDTAKDQQDTPLKIKQSKRLQDKSVPLSPGIDLVKSLTVLRVKEAGGRDDSLPHNKTDKAFSGPVGKSKSASATPRIQPSRSTKDLTEDQDIVTEKSEKVKKRKDKSIAPLELEENVTTPKPKKKRDSDVGLTPVDRTVPATINEQTPLSKSKPEVSDKKSNKKSKKENASPALNTSRSSEKGVVKKKVHVKKSFPRYFSMESQKAIK